MFGSVAIYWLVRDNHFISGCHVFNDEVDKGNQILSIFGKKTG